jgi:hypothetical protein
MSSYPAGWYPDYAQAGQQRYWDGEQWTGYVHVPAGTGGGPRWRRGRQPKFRPSAQLVDATYRMLFADRAMIALLLVGAVVAATAGGLILFPATYWGHVTPSRSSGGVLGVVVAGASLGAVTLVLQVVSGAVVAAAVLRAEGRPSTVREALRIAWSRRRQLLAWALVATLVGAVIRMLERVGLGGLLAALTLNLGWALAAVFATPVIVVEGTMPVATVRRSAGLVRRHFTVTLISSITLAVPWILLGIGSVILATAGGLTMAFASGVIATTVGALLLVVGAVCFCFVAAVTSALSAYLETFLYRYAVGLPVPGVDQRWLPPLRPS